MISRSLITNWVRRGLILPEITQLCMSIIKVCVHPRSSNGVTQPCVLSQLYQCNKTWTKWPPSCRWHFNAYSSEKMISVFIFKYHWRLFLRVQLSMMQRWYGWLGVQQATSQSDGTSFPSFPFSVVSLVCEYHEPFYRIYTSHTYNETHLTPTLC